MSKKIKKTRIALLMSAISIVLCFSMLVGTTFAWFTDEAVSKNNIIKAGTLDVAMAWAEGTKAVPDRDSDDWKDASTVAIFDYDLWEPGYTQVRHIKISNEGTLALKYQLNIVANGEVSELADVIDVYYADPAVQVTDRTDLDVDMKLGTLTEVLANISTTASGNLLAGEAHTITLALKMQEEAGNKYQGLSIGSDFSVQLLATQLTSEFDSFDDQYDKNAPVIKVSTAKEAQAALDIAEDGTIIYLAEAINYGDLLIRVNEDSELVDYYYVMTNYNSNYYGQADWQYAKRTINNLTITGVEGAIINSLTTSDARDDAGNAKGTRNNMFEINNLKISNITVNNTISFNVSNETAAISAEETTTVPHVKLNGLTIDNCKTTTGGDATQATGRKLLGIAHTGAISDTNTSNAKNITVTNCTVTAMYQGVYIVDGENVRVEGNTFTNLTHNAIHINSFCSGDIVVANNTIAKVDDRPIRFNKANGKIMIKGNVITNIGDDEGELFRASGMDIADIAWENNTINNFTIALMTVGSDVIGIKPVATADELREALTVGKNVVLANDITVDNWIMFSETKTIGNGKIITVKMDGLTIDGNGHTLTVNSIESAGNGNHLFDNASNLNISNLTIKKNCGAGAISLVSGVISNVNFVGGGYGIHPGAGEITVENCTFATADGDAIYFEQERDNLTVTGCTFNQLDGENVILLRGDVNFTNNTVNSGRTVNIVSGSPVVTGNNFNNVRLKVYSAATANISGNTINNLAFEDNATAYSSIFADNTMSAEAQAALSLMTTN